MQRVHEILDFWFGKPDSPEFGEYRRIWFRGGPAFDAEITTRFLDYHETALAGELDHWRDDAQACLALLLLFDQFSRNMFRGGPRSYATDPLAREIARHAIARGFDKGRHPIECQFYYLPFEHSEDMADQHRSVELMSAMPENEKKKDNILHAERHREVIKRFGRFPSRNQFLGRESTPEEIKFMAENPDYNFGQNRDP